MSQSVADLLKLQYNENGLMTIEWQAEMIKAWLDVWVAPRGGYTKVLANPKHLWEEIFVTDEKPRVLVCFNGEISRGGFTAANTMHRVDRQWIVAIIRGHGFQNLASEGQGQDGTPGAIDPFYKNCETIRDKCRVLLNISEEPPIDYKGMDPMPSIAPYGSSGNVFLDGFAVKFSTANDIPAVTSIDPDAQ
jgi:hypothetical protein